MAITQSLLKNKKEFLTLKFTALPVPPCAMHPDMEWASAQFIQWTKQFSDYNEKMCSDFEIKFYEIFTIKCSKERLLNYCKAFDFIFALETYLEPIREKRSSEMMVQLINKLLKALESNECDEEFALGRRLIEGLNAISDELCDDQKEYMREEIKKGFNAHLNIHCNYWLNNNFVPFDQYVELRIAESFWKYSTFLTEYMIGYQMPNAVRNNPLVAQFNALVAELSLAVDDYYLLMPKIVANDITSECLSYAFTNSCSLQEAIDRQFTRVLDLQNRCQQLMREINATPDLCSQPLDAYMQCVVENGNRLFVFAATVHKYTIADDMTVTSEYWDRLYERLQSVSTVMFTNCFRTDKVM